MNNGILGYGGRTGGRHRRGDVFTLGRPAGRGLDPTIYHVGIIGQSNANNGSGDAAVSTRPQPGRPLGWMFNGHVRPGGAATQLSSLVPLYEDTTFFSTSDAGSESVAWGFCWRMSRLRPGTSLLFSTSAIGGTAYAAMARGTATYNQMLAQVAAGKNLAARAGRPYRFLCFLLLHGEQDQTIANTGYAANLATWQANYEQDVRAVTGQGEPVPFYACQQSSSSPAMGATASAAQQLYTAWKTAPDKVVLIGSRLVYPCEQSDGAPVHISSYAQRWHGQRYADAVFARQFLGQDWRPVAPITGQVNFDTGVGGSPSATIVANFYCPAPPLALDFSQVTKNTNQTYGFSYFDDTSPPTVTAVAVTGPQQITLTLSGTPTGTAASRVLRAGWGTGSGVQGTPTRGAMRINLRDSVADTGYAGVPLQNWCSIFSEAVT